MLVRVVVLGPPPCASRAVPVLQTPAQGQHVAMGAEALAMGHRPVTPPPQTREVAVHVRTTRGVNAMAQRNIVKRIKINHYVLEEDVDVTLTVAVTDQHRVVVVPAPPTPLPLLQPPLTHLLLPTHLPLPSPPHQTW